MSSISRQLQLTLALALTIGAVCVFSLCFYLLDRQFRDATLAQLGRDADTLSAAIFEQEDGTLALDGARVPRPFNVPYSGHYFLISLDSEEWRSRSLWDFSLDAKTLEETYVASQLTDGPRQQQLLLLQRTYTRFGETIGLTVGADYRPTLNQLRTMAGVSAAIFLGFLFGLLALQRWIIQRSLRPLKSLELKINALREGERIEFDETYPRELLPLVDELERLLNSTEHTLRRSRTHLSNLSHALKTPLAVLYSKLNQPEWRDRPDVTAVREQLDAIANRISRELGRARLSGDVLPGNYFSPAKELPDLINTLQLIHPRDLQIASDYPSDFQLMMDREDALELIGNLLDNACKWARSRVALEFHPNPAGAELSIRDDGPGIAPTDLTRVQVRGQRLDEAVPGHGVGLSVVQDICHHLGATLDFAAASGGGLCVTVKFPPDMTGRTAKSARLH